MLPPLLTARPRPQTLLLTALSLLIAVATLMLACGPVAQPVPVAEPNPLPPAKQADSDSVGESADETPTEMPLPPPLPTIIYPNIQGSLNFDVMEFEAAQKSEVGPSGRVPEAMEDTVVLVRILLSGNKAEIAAWLRSRGITPIYADDADYAHLAAEVPLSLLGKLSQQDGVREISLPDQRKPGSW